MSTSFLSERRENENGAVLIVLSLLFFRPGDGLYKRRFEKTEQKELEIRAVPCVPPPVDTYVLYVAALL